MAIAIICATVGLNNADAAVAQRGAPVKRTPVVSAQKVAAAPTVAAAAATVAEPAPTVVEPAPVATSAPQDTTPDLDDVIIEDKTSQFDEVLGDMAVNTSKSASNELAENIRRQRAALDAQSATATVAAKTAAAQSGGSACDNGLRECMKQKCGNDFSKCTGDSDTIWGGKMESCKRDLPCTGEEFTLFAREIKEDRDMTARIGIYQSILDCGNEYNDCIITQCGTKFEKCLGKKKGDAAIASCDKIAKKCVQQDSGLSARSMEIFATVRQDAEKQVRADEERLYKLRDDMRSQCSRLGAMLDERTMDCVFTVEFYAGSESTLYASKKVYAGSTFDCTPNWFGIDITTFKENAARLTREQQSATSAMLGSGLGVAGGAITSGAINRAIDTKKAKTALNKAKKEAGQDDKAEKKAEKEDKQAEREAKRDARQAKETKKKIDDAKKDIAKNQDKITAERMESVEKDISTKLDNQIKEQQKAALDNQLKMDMSKLDFSDPKPFTPSETTDAGAKGDSAKADSANAGAKADSGDNK